jgi:hypothetical protein
MQLVVGVEIGHEAIIEPVRDHYELMWVVSEFAQIGFDPPDVGNTPSCLSVKEHGEGIRRRSTETWMTKRCGLDADSMSV